MLPISVMINILFLLISIAVGLFWAKRQDTEDSNALRDIKNGMASGMVYTLLETYAKTLSPIVAPMIDQRRGNPVLFDRTTFQELTKVTGDAGGRQVFSQFPVTYVPWLDTRFGLDVDTLEDYERLKSSYDQLD